MFAEIEEAIISALQKNLKGVKKGGIGSARVSPKSGVPYVQVTSGGFTVADSVLGGSVEPDDTVTDAFSGDGEKRLFKLSEPPVRPVAWVEVNGSRVSYTGYEVDYRNATLEFKSPPGAGENNIRASYRRPYETRGLRLKIVYQVNVWGKDERERDQLADEAMMGLLMEEDALNKQGIILSLLEGRNVESADLDALGKCIEYSVEADLKVKIPVGRMEEIEVKRPERIG